MKNLVLLVSCIFTLISNTFCQIIVSCKSEQTLAANKNIFGECIAPINLDVVASDNSTAADELLYSYTIDLYSDQKTDAEVSALSLRQYRAGQKPAINNNPWADQNGYPFDANGKYPLGKHKICFEIVNASLEKASCCREFEVRDKKTPNIKFISNPCVQFKSGANLVLILKAEEFISEASDNCTSAENLNYNWNSIINKEPIIISCDEFIRMQKNMKTEFSQYICAEDEEGNFECQQITINVQDPNVVCGCKGTYSISGKYFGDFITEPTLKDQTGKIIALKNQILLDKNEFFINDLSPGSYELSFNDNADPLNGVSNLDMVKIRKHILGLEPFKDISQFFSADVDLSGTITAKDISIIRKLIFGEIDAFPIRKSGIVIPKPINFVFPTNVKEL